MARPRTFDDEHVLNVVLETFWRSGFEATSLADLVAATGLKKGSLYGAFGDKQSMFCKAIGVYDARYVDSAIAMMADKPGDEAIALLMSLPAEAVRMGDTRGCFLCNTLQETGQLAADTRTTAQNSQRKLRGAVQAALERCVSPGKPDAASIDEWLALYFGLRVLSRANMSADELLGIAKRATGRLEKQSGV